MAVCVCGELNAEQDDTWEEMQQLEVTSFTDVAPLKGQTVTNMPVSIAGQVSADGIVEMANAALKVGHESDVSQDPFAVDANIKVVAEKLTKQAEIDVQRLEKELKRRKEAIKSQAATTKREDEKLKKDLELDKKKETDQSKWKALEEKAFSERAALREKSQMHRMHIEKLEAELDSKGWTKWTSKILSRLGPILQYYIETQLYYIRWKENSKAVSDGINAIKEDYIDVHNRNYKSKWGDRGGLAKIRQEAMEIARPIVSLQTKVWLQDQAEELWSGCSLMVGKLKKDMGFALSKVEMGLHLVNEVTIDFNAGMVGLVTLLWQAMKMTFTRVILPALGEAYSQKASELMVHTLIEGIESKPFDRLMVISLGETAKIVKKISFLTDKQKARRKKKEEHSGMFDRALEYMTQLVKNNNDKEEEKKTRLWRGEGAVLRCQPKPLRPEDLKREQELLAGKHFGWKANYGLTSTIAKGDMKRAEALADWEKAGKPSVDLVESWEHYGWRWKSQS